MGNRQFVEPEIQYERLNKSVGLLLDPCDIDILRYKKFHPSKHRNRIYLYGSGISLHRIIAHRIAKRPLTRKDYTDHINGNTMDNRRCNLRVVSNAINLQNRGKQKNSTTGYAGVWYCKQTGKWGAELTRFKKKIWLGRFKTAEEAAQAREKAFARYAIL